MSNANSRWKKIREALKSSKSPQEYRLEELVSIEQKGKADVSERVASSKLLMERMELLYRLEPLIFSGVNKLTRRISGSDIYFTGEDEEENEKALQFFKESNALKLLSHLVKDTFIYGFGVCEIKKRGKEIKLVQLDPKEFDYKRDGTEIALDKSGNIIGYTWESSKTTKEVDLKPEEVLLINYYSIGSFCLGISPIEAAFKTAWIKLNLEEALGEAIFRHGFPQIKYKIGTQEQGPWHEVTPAKIKEAKKILSAQDTASELVLPWWMDAEILKGKGDLGNVHMFLELLSMEILAALELPKAFGIETRGLGGRAVEEMDFEKTLLSFQQELKRQLDEQLLTPYYKAANFKTHPVLTFTEYSPELQNIRLRRLSAYAKHGLITRTDELENALRRTEGFPPKKKKKEDDESTTKCIFGLANCPIREEEDVPLDKLSAFCNICTFRLREEKEIKRRAETDDKEEN